MADTVASWQPALDRLSLLSASQVRLLHALSSGLSNVSLKVEFDNQLAVFRINQPLPGVDRGAEIQILNQLAPYSWAPELLFADPNLGLVTRWFESINSIDSGEDCLNSIPVILKQLHGERCVHPSLGLMHRIGDYIRRLDADWLSTCPVNPILQSLQAHRIDLTDQTLVHMDLNPSNLILTRKGTRLIDFEYAGGGHPLMDLASICHTHDLDPDQQDRLLSNYGAPAHWRKALPHALSLTCWLDAAWQRLTPSRRPQQ